MERKITIQLTRKQIADWVSGELLCIDGHRPTFKNLSVSVDTEEGTFELPDDGIKVQWEE